MGIILASGNAHQITKGLHKAIAMIVTTSICEANELADTDAQDDKQGDDLRNFLVATANNQTYICLQNCDSRISPKWVQLTEYEITSKAQHHLDFTILTMNTIQTFKLPI